MSNSLTALQVALTLPAGVTKLLVSDLQVTSTLRLRNIDEYVMSFVADGATDASCLLTPVFSGVASSAEFSDDSHPAIDVDTGTKVVVLPGVSDFSITSAADTVGVLTITGYQYPKAPAGSFVAIEVTA